MTEKRIRQVDPEVRAKSFIPKERPSPEKSLKAVEGKPVRAERPRVTREVPTTQVPREQAINPEETAGKDRLRELVERGEVNQSVIDRLAVYLNCEPWQALQKIEGKSEVYTQMVLEHKNRKFLHESEVLRIKAQQPGGREEYFQKIDAEFSLGDILDEHVQVERILLGLDESFNRARGSFFRTTTTHFLSGKFGFLPSFDPSVMLPQKGNLDFYPHKSFRTDYWTISRLVAMASPKDNGFENAKEADRLITAEVERIGRESGSSIRFEDGAFYVGKKDSQTEKIAALDILDAQRLIAEFRKVSEIKQQREREFRAKMRTMLLRLSQINQELHTNLPVLRSEVGIVARFMHWLSPAREAQFGRVDHAMATLKEERLKIINDLDRLNFEVWPGGNNSPKYESRYDLYAFKDSGRGRAIDEFKEREDLWGKVAEEEVVRMVDEDMARDQLPALKEQHRSK